MLIDDLRGRAINLRNFAAHKKPVLCSRIGRKSGQIFATGSEDAIVKVWHAANDEPLMSLIGHKSPITCLTFNNTEDLLIAAAESGSIRSWDLNSGQQLNHSSAIYVNGHRASVTCIDYHPFANYFATGSLDTNLKVWDVKERKAVQTYKGQVEKEAVTVVKFTPDGKWIVTGCEDGYLRVYDVIAGKLFFQTQAHRNALTCMDFHPSDFLVATGSLDRTVSIFNIDGGIDMVSRSDIFPSAIKSVQFSPNEGSVILSICNEGMKVHGWKGESMRCIDNVDARWSDVGDVYLHQGLNQVMTVANNPNINGYVGVWVIPVDSVKPWYTGSGDDNKKVLLSPQITQESFNENLNSSTEDVLNEIRNRKPVSVSTTTTNNGEVFTVTKVSGEGKKTPQLGGQTPEVAIVSAKRKEPANLDIDNFLPKGEAIITDMDDEDIINGIMKSHQKMAVAMTNRLNNLKIVRRTWLDQGDPKEAIKAMAKMKDLPLASDMLNELLRPESKKNLSLDMCVYLLPIIIELVQENYEEHISTALKITHLLHNCFAQLIEDNLQLANSNAQIDINLEARISKCQSCKKYFGEVKRIIIGRSADFAQLTDLALLSRRVVKSIK